MVGKNSLELPTPALIVDLDCVERNLERTAKLVLNSGKALRPHIKTHKMPKLAAMELASGAVGICAAKLSEAEVMADSGVNDILLANEVIGQDKLERLAALAKRTQLTVLADSEHGVTLLSKLAEKHHIMLNVLVEVETGDKRCGISPEAAPGLIDRILASPGLEFRGLETFGGWVYHSADANHMAEKARQTADILLTLKARLECEGVQVETVSIGGSPSLQELSKLDGITELRPGVYIFNDTASVYRGTVGFADCAATVLTTVISKPAPGRMVVDGGAKTFSYCCPGSIFGKSIRYGVLKDNTDICLTQLSEEHGVVEGDRGLERYCVGDKLEIIPTHICPVVNLFDIAYLCRNGKVEEVLPVAARGKTQ